MKILGVDVGGTGIKGGIVDAEKGILLTERHKILTPKPSTPKAIVATIKKLKEHFAWDGPIGCGYPAIIKRGVALSAGNIDPTNFGMNVQEMMEKELQCEVHVLNDADAAGVAEMRFGAGVGKMGKVVVVTIGTGLGSGLFYNNQLIPNLELGRLLYRDMEIVERWVSEFVRKSEGLSYEKFGKRLTKFFQYANNVISPDLYIIGGGGGKKLHKFQEYLTIDTPFVQAKFKNEAGTIGAALTAWDRMKK